MRNIDMLAKFLLFRDPNLIGNVKENKFFKRKKREDAIFFILTRIY